MSGAEPIIPFIWAASSVTCAYLTSFAEDNPNHANNEKNEETTCTTQPTRIVMPTAMRLDSPPPYHQQEQQDDGAASLVTMETAELSLNFSWSVDSSAFAPYSYNEDNSLCVDSTRTTPCSTYANTERSPFQS